MEVISNTGNNNNKKSSLPRDTFQSIPLSGTKPSQKRKISSLTVKKANTSRCRTNGDPNQGSAQKIARIERTRAFDNDDDESVTVAIEETGNKTPVSKPNSVIHSNNINDDDDEMNITSTKPNRALSMDIHELPCNTPMDYTIALNRYYSQLFPFELLFEWLGFPCRSIAELKKAAREFSFMKRLFHGEQVVTRFKFYPCSGDWKSDILAHCPPKIDAGALYFVPAQPVHTRVSSGHGSSEASESAPAEVKREAVGKELVLDVDFTDYKNVWNAPLTDAHWFVMEAAILVLSHLLERLGIPRASVLWVYSGSKGIHAWISDARVFTFADEERADVLFYLRRVDSDGNPVHETSTDSLRGGVHQRKLYPWERSLGGAGRKDEKLLRSLCALLLPFFIEHVAVKRDWKCDTGSIPELLRQAYRSSETTRIHDAGYDTATESTTFEAALRSFEENMKKQAHASYRKKVWNSFATAYPVISRSVIFRLLFPRLDSEVTRSRVHLLKLPFSPHADTHRISIPIENASTFLPSTVPILTSPSTASLDPQMLSSLAYFANYVTYLRSSHEVRQ